MAKPYFTAEGNFTNPLGFISLKKPSTFVDGFFMGWVMGFEPTNTGTTIRGLRPLGDTHHIQLAEIVLEWHARRDSNP